MYYKNFHCWIFNLAICEDIESQNKSLVHIKVSQKTFYTSSGDCKSALSLSRGETAAKGFFLLLYWIALRTLWLSLRYNNIFSSIWNPIAGIPQNAVSSIFSLPNLIAIDRQFFNYSDMTGHCIQAKSLVNV